MRNTLCMAVLVVMLSLNSHSESGQAAAAEQTQGAGQTQEAGQTHATVQAAEQNAEQNKEAPPQPSPGQASQDADKPQAFQPNGYVDASGHPHFQLTPEGDVVTPPGAGPKSQANAKIAGAGARGIPATPAFPCPPRPVPTPLPKAEQKERNHLVGYLSLLLSMEAWDDEADKEEKRGELKEAESMRSLPMGIFGWNDAEAQIVREIRLDFSDAMKKHNQKALQARRNWRLATNGDMCAPASAEFAELDRENWEIVQAHIVQLQVALGAVAFQKMDEHVRKVYEPKPSLADTKGAKR